jgi:hypothetical protein
LSIVPDLADRQFFPPIQRAQTVALACRNPGDLGLPLVRWSVRSLATQLIEDEVVTDIHYSSVCLILQGADLKPHRTLYWKRSHDPEFESKAKHVLWYYENADRLIRDGELVFCLDEKPGIQLLGRRLPDIAPEPGRPRRREFEYIRRGTGLLLMIYGLEDGAIVCETPEAKSSENLTRMVTRHSARFPDARRLHYILDNDSTHKSDFTRQWIRSQDGRIRFHFTPTGASWLNQAETALSAFSRRYLRGRTWDRVEDFPLIVRQSARHYNAEFAHRFDWSFTRNRFREWLNRSSTSSTRH